MAEGFQAMAQDGSDMLQVDGQYQNLFLRYKISSATDNVEVANFTSRRLLDVSCFGIPVVAVSNSFPVSVTVIDTGQGMGNPGTYRLTFIMPGNVGTAFSAYIFDALQNSDASNFGLQVFRQPGDVLIFDGARKPMRVVGLFTVQAEAGGFFDAVSGRTYAVACTSGFYTKNVGAPQFGYFRYGGVVQNGTRAAVANFQSGFQPTTTAYGADRPSMGIAVDVTNY